ncbi:unnamed protein product [Closterium sp. NIES-53]
MTVDAPNCATNSLVGHKDPLPGTLTVEVAGDSGAAQGAAFRGAASKGVGAPAFGSGAAGARDPAARDTGARGAGLTAGARSTRGAVAAGPGGARTRGTGAAGTRSVGGAGAGGAAAGDPAEPGGAGAGGTGAGGAGAGGAGAGDPGAVGAGAGGTGAGGAGAGCCSGSVTLRGYDELNSQLNANPLGAVDGGAVSGGTSTGGTVRPRPYFVPLLQQVLGLPSSADLTPPFLCPPPDQSQPPLQPASPLPAPSPYSEQTGGLTKRREPESRPALPVCAVRTGRRVPRPRPPHGPRTHTMALRPSSIPLRVPLTAPPESSLPAVPDPKSDLSRTASPTVSRLLATVVSDPSFESTAAFALVDELVDFAAAYRLDYATALVADLHEEIWLRRPPGFTGSFPAGTQWSLWRPVYGLRHAPREWHDTLRTTLAALGFTPSAADPSLFLRTDTSLPPFYVLVYVLQHFGFQFSSPQPTPLSTGHSLSAPPLDESVELSELYPKLVGCLMYPLSLPARYVAPDRHRKVHWDAAKRVLCYLCSTSGMGLVLGGRGLVVLSGHADASWVDDSATQRSLQGYTFSLGSGSVSWRSTRSSLVLSSSCEAEIYAGAMAEIDLGEQPRLPPVLYVDNKAMIALCQEHRLEHRTKHIALRYFLARELQQRG